MAHVVHTGSSRICGRPEEGVLAFRGLPYAPPPIGPLRFRPPQKPVAWGTRAERLGGRWGCDTRAQG
jgi:para-nitrobenzyl esterase